MRAQIEEVLRLISNVDYSSLFWGFAVKKYLIVLDDFQFIHDGALKRQKERVEQLRNSVYDLDGENYAVWDMRHNDVNWNEVDIACGIIHEMFHCYQFDVGFYDALVKAKSNGIMNDFRFLINLEGVALYVEQLAKMHFAHKQWSTLSSEYMKFTEKHPECVPYFLGAEFAHLMSEKDQEWQGQYLFGSVFL